MKLNRRRIGGAAAALVSIAAIAIAPAAPAAADPAAAGTGASQAHTSSQHPRAVTTNATDEQAILALVNAARIAACAPVLARNHSMDTVARNWSTTMSVTGTFEHNPRYAAQLPNGWHAAAENIAAGPATGRGMFDLWKKSPPHWESILNPVYTDIGIGMVTNPASRHGTYATQVFGAYPARSAGTFLDVRQGHPFYSEIGWLTDRGITTGYPVTGCSRTTFQPLNRVSREAMAAFLFRYQAPSGYQPPATSPFRDLPVGHKFYKEITWLAESGITQGWDVPDGTEFRPRNRISREAMAAFMHRFAGSPPVAGASRTFTDVPSTHTFHTEITWLANAKITQGWDVAGGTQFRPRNHTSREASAAFLQRLDATL